MKMKRSALLATCLATALGAQLTLAQTGNSQAPGTHSSDQRSGTTSQGTDASTSGLQVSKLLGAHVKSNTGENLGKLEDVILDPQTGRATFAVIGKGGILKLGEKRLPVPWQALRVDSQKQLTLNMDKDRLGTAPTFQSSASDLDNPDFVMVVYKFYEIPAGAGETPGGKQSDSATSPTNSSTPTSNP
jgi:sporulation protein YlmC with PRC-barrel domain